ncbi:MAG: methylmalonyl-CoA mutase family protein [Hyphomicrobium sp.]
MVGVNKFQQKEEAPIDILDVDNDAVRESQVTRLTNIRKTRDEAKCVAALKALGEAARNGTGNLLTLAIEATRARATVGEILLGAGRRLWPLPGHRPLDPPASMPASGRATRGSTVSAPTSRPSPRKKAAGRA